MLYEIYMLIFHFDGLKDVVVNVATKVFELLSRL